jgi:mRNA-degrading endonuclease RelE of RelBE toxin-antitoxin system
MPTAAHQLQKLPVKFRKAMRQILSIDKKELDRREAEYKKQRAKEKRLGKA